MVHNEAAACSYNHGRQSLLQKIQGLLQGHHSLFNKNIFLQVIAPLFHVLCSSLVPYVIYSSLLTNLTMLQILSTIFSSGDPTPTLYLSAIAYAFVLIVQPGMEGGRNCYSDEHYLPTFFYVRTVLLSAFGYQNLFLSLFILCLSKFPIISDA